MVLLTSSICIRKGSHLAVDYLTHGLSGYANKILEIIDTEISIEDDDQLFYTNIFLENAEDTTIIEPKEYPTPEDNKWGVQWDGSNIGSMSQRFLDDEIVSYLKTNYPSDAKVIDLGCGDGKWAFALGEHFKNIHGVESYLNYVNSLNLQEIYSKIHFDNFLNIDFEYYDVVIMGDVLHHLSKNDAIEFFDKIKDKVGEIIITVPFGMTDTSASENIFEDVKQPDLSPKVILDRYPML